MLYSANYLSTLGSNVSLYAIAFTLLPFVAVLLLFDIQYVATGYLSFEAMGSVSAIGSHALPATAIISIASLTSQLLVLK
jgi:TRAP-type mannitol/chloroaromatic compound transport system permease small subunit